MEEEIKKEIIGKAGFPLYVDYWEKYFSQMSDKQVKECLKIIFHFNINFEVLRSDDLAVKMVINTIIDNLKRDAQKRIKQSKASRANGLLGGRPRKNEANTSKSKQKATKSAGNNSKNESKDDCGIIIPDFIDVKTWNNFVKMRSEIKKPITNSIAKACVEKLINFESKKIGNANLSLQNSIAGGYQGLFEPKTSNNYQSQSPLGWLNK